MSIATNPQLAFFETPACLLCGSARVKTTAEHGPKRLQKCRRCGVLFVIPQPSTDSLTHHFAGGGLPGIDAFDSHFEINRQPVLSQIADDILARKDAGTILDVGCATGLFLADFAHKLDWRARGVELTLPAAEQARRRGIQVHVGDTRSASFGANSFDVITVLDTFYYFPHPAAELGEFGRILKPDGFLALELPWAHSRIWQRHSMTGKILNRHRVPLLESSDHLFYYTPKSVSRLLAGCGFVVQAIRPLPANRQESRPRDFLWRTYAFFSRLLWRMSFGGIFLGPRFLVVAEKKPAPFRDQKPNHVPTQP